jgi:hypothetical protein
VENIITYPLQQVSNTKLRTELLNRLLPSREQRVHQLLTLEEMGDSKPSQLWRHLRSRASDYFLRSNWTSWQTPNV